MKVVICIPAYNEERSIGEVIREIKNVMNSTNYKYRILVVDDGSTDRTFDLATKEKVIVIKNVRNVGLVETFKREMEECLKINPDIIIHTDADGQYPSYYIPELIKKIEEGNDIVLGSRFGDGIYSGSIMKKLGNKAFAWVFSNLLKKKLTDTTTGFRAFTKEVARFPLINSFTYTQEQLIRAGKMKMKIIEIPIKTNKTRKSRLFKNSFDYAIKAWINIFRIYRDFAPLKFFGVFGSFLFLIGLILGFYVLILWLLTGRVGGVPRVILSGVLMLFGVQIILFGFLADMIKK